MNPPIQLLNDNQSVTSAVYNEAQPKYANPLMNNASIMSNMYGNQNLGNSGMLNQNLAAELSQNLSNRQVTPSSMNHTNIGQSMIGNNSFLGRFNAAPQQYNNVNMQNYADASPKNQMANNSFLALNPSLDANNVSLLSNSVFIDRNNMLFNKPNVPNEQSRGILQQLPLFTSNNSYSQQNNPITQMQKNFQEGTNGNFNQQIDGMIKKGQNK